MIVINLTKYYLPKVAVSYLNCGFRFSTIHSTVLRRRTVLENGGGKFQTHNLKLVGSNIRKIANITNKNYKQNTECFRSITSLFYEVR